MRYQNLKNFLQEVADEINRDQKVNLKVRPVTGWPLGLVYGKLDLQAGLLNGKELTIMATGTNSQRLRTTMARHCHDLHIFRDCLDAGFLSGSFFYMEA